ncbi:OLC1v1023281C1 [Oldenlandia corymbosa var. corymbosa]|uniref:folate gamma-glutamyl hydrolase n=1 Tax=Oldenlandia corymbosa var. corymbosa TaxID=529605 RepID=A0AAV1C195_OLDCO|nr:OLC1v1023281C1 [Oldenlandia corymbosa var. corymbosa]
MSPTPSPSSSSVTTNQSSSNSTPTLPPINPASAATSSSCDMFNLYHLWISLLFASTKDLVAASASADKLVKEESRTTLLLPSENRTGTTAVIQQHRASPSCPALNPKLNYRPVVGILSHPGDGASGRLNNDSNASYIAASYVKFVESAGARVIPLIYNEPLDVLEEKLSLVNGVLFTGGWAKNGLYYDRVATVFQKVLEKNDAGDHFPLVAICLGFELLTMIISKDKNILEQFSAGDQASTLQFMENIKLQGTVFQRFPPDLLKKLSTDCLVMQNHHYGISPETFRKNSDLCNFFEILTTSEDEDNKVYVSTVKAHHYPITAFQWHPEKNAFEWGLSRIPHSEDAIQVTQYVANFFISEVRKSLNRPPTRKVLDNLIYNFTPTYCGRAGRGYDEVYIFARPSMRECSSVKCKY